MLQAGRSRMQVGGVLAGPLADTRAGHAQLAGARDDLAEQVMDDGVRGAVDADRVPPAPSRFPGVHSTRVTPVYWTAIVRRRCQRRRGDGSPGRATARRLCMVAPDGTRCYHGRVSANPEITQRDLRTKSREIMDAVEHGQSFTVTRDGHRIGELIPLRQRRRFVPRQEFIAMSRNAPAADLEAFRADQDAALDHGAGSRYER